MIDSKIVRRTPKPKQICVSEELKKDLELVREILDLSQTELMEELFKAWKEQNKESWKKLNTYKKLKSGL